MITTPEAARDAGIAAVLRTNEQWLAECKNLVPDFLSGAGKTFTGEDIRFFMEKRGLIPNHPNGWGGLIQGLIKGKRIYPSGKTKKMRNVSSHARANPIYSAVPVLTERSVARDISVWLVGLVDRVVEPDLMDQEDRDTLDEIRGWLKL